MGYKYLLDANESSVYCGHNLEDAGNFLNLVVMKIMEEQCCTMLDLINFDCAIHYVIVKPAGYGAVHGWTEAQVQRMYIESRSDGHWVHLGPPVNLNDRKEEKKEMKDVNQKVRSCANCVYRYTLVTKQPCCKCNSDTHNNYIPVKNKGEKEMNCHEEDSMEIDRNSIIPKRIWFNEHDGKCFTTVEWGDGVKTTVSETLNATDYGGFTAALAKRIYGTGGTIRLMNQAIDKANEKKKLREEQRKQDRFLKQREREIEAELRKEAHEKRVREAIEKLRVEQEVQKRLRDVRFQNFARALLSLNAQKKTNSNNKTAKEDHAE